MTKTEQAKRIEELEKRVSELETQRDTLLQVLAEKSVPAMWQIPIWPQAAPNPYRPTWISDESTAGQPNITWGDGGTLECSAPGAVAGLTTIEA